LHLIIALLSAVKPLLWMEGKQYASSLITFNSKSRLLNPCEK
jgi:hypothetical protein